MRIEGCTEIWTRKHSQPRREIPKTVLYWSFRFSPERNLALLESTPLTLSERSCFLEFKVLYRVTSSFILGCVRFHPGNWEISVDRPWGSHVLRYGLFLGRNLQESAIPPQGQHVVRAPHRAGRGRRFFSASFVKWKIQGAMRQLFRGICVRSEGSAKGRTRSPTNIRSPSDVQIGGLLSLLRFTSPNSQYRLRTATTASTLAST